MQALNLQTYVFVCRGSTKSTFTAIGDISEVEITPKPTYKIHSGPTTRGRRRKSVVPIGAELDFGFTISEMSGFVYENLFLTSALTMTGTQQYNPMEGTTPWVGWVKFQQYDGGGTLKNIVDVYCALTAESTRLPDNDEVTVKFKGEVLENTSTTGQLENLT
jgi:hypothetical protein